VSQVTVARARPPAAGRRLRGASWARGLAGVVAALLVAEALGRSGLISQSVLPLASTVLARAIGLAGNGTFLRAVGATLEALAAGLGIAVAVAVPAGLILGSVPGVRSATRAIVEFLRPIPAVSLIPLAALVLGAGLRMNITLVVYATVWPVLFNTLHGLDDVDPLAKETLRAFGFGPLAVIRRVCLPAAAPFILTGIRLAASVALVLSVGVGVITGKIDGNGIGAYIADTSSSGSGTTAQTLAAALWAGVLGLALNELLAWAGRRALPWYHGFLGEAE
jgi:NitT/TauT family transport system permease protein